ncbi:hypothetical protein O6H91_08G065500 [Diphasiastrum complanatum]|uniref:Uncharacterized protein n=1 Tax=Diphasiastrum complanatum TaxID=34168 RepID=A0ACC2CYK6_DIPCM|nr:hypothetical protein O6H91_08G065500 [Diphasiastrum complanatum]
MNCCVWLHRSGRRCAAFLSFPICQSISALPAIQSSLANFPRLSHLCDPYGSAKGLPKSLLSPCSGITDSFFQQKPVFCSSRKTSMQASAPKSDNEPQTSEIAGSAGRRFAVFVTGYASEYAERTYGGYGNMFARLLGDPVLQSLHEKRKKMLGVCFGHQVLSRALGGKTGRTEVGWEIGVKNVTLTDAISSKSYGSGLPRILKVLQSHRDQVLELPPGGELLGSSEKTGIEVFAIGEHVLGIQGHPEYTKDVLLDMIDSRCALGIIEEAAANMAKASILAYEDDKEILRNLCKAFLKRQHV